MHRIKMYLCKRTILSEFIYNKRVLIKEISSYNEDNCISFVCKNDLRNLHYICVRQLKVLSPFYCHSKKHISTSVKKVFQPECAFVFERHMRNIQAIWIESKTIIDEVCVPAANAFVVDRTLCFIDASIIIFYFFIYFCLFL